MKISYNGLKKFVDIKVSPQKLADDLSLFGHEAETINKVGDDFILDFEITPNRGDCLSIFGMAREISALYNLKLTPTPRQQRGYGAPTTSVGENLDKSIKVKISDSAICPRYSARIIENIKINESPVWLQNDLKKLGINPVNNIVDITNYIMIETGQPMHAFDYDKIKNGVINIRKSSLNEKIQTLDNINYNLPANAIVINDDKQIYDLAGIMGGANSRIDKLTKNIVLQAAVFDPVLIRQTSKALNKATEASYRYERGVDVENTINALNGATELIIKLCPLTNTSDVIDIYATQKTNKIKVNYKQINHLIGIKLSQDEIFDYLARLGFIKEGDYVIVPSYRMYDVKIWQDIAEEVARIYGYNNLHRCTDFTNATNNAKADGEFIKKEALKDILVELGFNEVYSYSFVDRNLITKIGFNLSKCKQVINGISPETQFLRPSILISLLAAVSKNPWAPEVNIFEIGKVFSEEGEKYQLGITQVGKNPALIKTALQQLGVNKPIESVDQSILDYLKIRRPVKYVLFDIDELKINKLNYSNKVSDIKYSDVSQFPPTIRDLAFIVDEKINSETVRKSIETTDDHILLVELFDEFTSDKFGTNKKNIAYHIWLQDLKKPMDTKETDDIGKKIIKTIEQKFSAKIRS